MIALLHDAIVLLAVLVLVHLLMDYPLQGDFLAKGKAGAFEPHAPAWLLLLSHALMHGIAVGLVLGSIWFGLVETALHWLIDRWKIKGTIGGSVAFVTDQAMHVMCKVAYVAVLVFIAA